MTRDDDIVRASELGQYAYCARAWWYARVKGYRPENRAALWRGTARHSQHGRRVVGYDLLGRLAVLLLLLAAAAVIAWLLLGGG